MPELIGRRRKKMFSALNVVSPTWPARVSRALSYTGPERRGGSGLMARLLTQMLDEIDYGLLLVAEGRHVLHANHAARTELTDQHPLQLLGRELRARCPRDVAPLHEALHQAAQRGLRRMLTMGEGVHRAGVSVVPIALGLPDAGDGHATLVVLGRKDVCSALAVQGFARAHQLSPGEELVLVALCDGLRPQDIAERHGVKIATIRTQIANIRLKTGSDSIRDLVQRVAVLPPMVGALRQDVLPMSETDQLDPVAA
jgi:DNA-binding CsgD family transcriptional regulator